MGKTKEEQAADHGWERVERPKIEKWEQGKVVQGIFKGLQEGRGEYKTPLLKVMVDDKLTIHSCPTVLQSYFEGVTSDMPVKIVCLGKTLKSKKGQNAWDFEVYYRS